MKSPGKPALAALAVALVAAGTLLSGNAAQKNPIAHNKEGWEHLRKEEYKKAVFSFRNALHGNPKYRDAILGLGTAYLHVEAYEQSYDLFSRALSIDPKSAEAHVGLGKTLTAMGRHTDAIRSFDRALKLSEQNMDARFGTAYVYVRLGKTIWAERRLQSILRVDPYHYDALLLMAEIKSGENRLREARRYVEKAIDANGESSLAHTTYGEILLREYLNTEDQDFLDEARNALANAIAIQPSGYRANRAMGYLALIEKNYGEAVTRFRTAAGDLESGPLLYSLAMAEDLAGNRDAALEGFLKAIQKDPADSILRARVEDFLVLRDYKIGNPLRVMLNRENYERALERTRKNYPDQAVMYLRRSIMLNPMNLEARTLLMDYYQAEGFNRFYIDEMKEILRIGEDRTWQEKLSLAVMKRRDLLYHREGYSAEDPPRDVPVILVLDFDPAGVMGSHPDAGGVIAGHLSFVLGQFGRMKPVGMRSRKTVECGLICGGDHLEESLAEVDRRIKSGEIDPVDYVVYGTFSESGNHIALDGRLLDYHKGFLIGSFTLYESGPESLPQVSLRAAKRIYDMIPFKGRVLKQKEEGIIVNMGLFDGISPGEKLVIYKFQRRVLPGDQLKKKMIFTVREADTLVSYAEPEQAVDLESVDANDDVLPLKKRRARRIE